MRQFNCLYLAMDRLQNCPILNIFILSCTFETWVYIFVDSNIWFVTEKVYTDIILSSD